MAGESPAEGIIEARYWSRLEDGQIQCDVCPRRCRLQDGQRGLCFVRALSAQKRTWCAQSYLVNRRVRTP